MWLPILLVGGLTLASMAIAYFAMDDHERARDLEAAQLLASAAASQSGCCVACSAPLHRAATSDQVVFEVERRIDAELQAIARLLHGGAESTGRVFHA